jgi:hypothetical protein
MKRATQLYRPVDSSSLNEAEYILHRNDTTDQDVIDFLQGKPRRPASDNNIHLHETLRQKFHQRRRNIRNLKDDLRHGRARIDEDGRLIPVAETINEPQEQPPPLNMHQMNNNIEHQDADLIEQGQRQAVEAIARAIARYREENVPEEDFELITIPPRGRRAVNPAFSRLFFTVSVCLTAFVVFIPILIDNFSSTEKVDRFFDKLMHELLNVRDFHSHLQHCPGLHRDNNSGSQRSIIDKLGYSIEENCDDGVLHIPAKHVILDKYLQASTEVNAAQLRPYKEGIDVSWKIPCNLQYSSRCQCAGENTGHSTIQKCFRGVHDNILSENEVNDVIGLGLSPTEHGSHHSKVYGAALLQKEIPKVMKKLKRLLNDEYNLEQPNPVAFRVTTSGPLDGYGVSFDRATTLNHSAYLTYVEENNNHNAMVASYFPWPFNAHPFRDKCNLIADLEVSPEFLIHTSLFLSDGAGRDYCGGATLFMDNHHSNFHRKERLRRGLSVDGSRGRVVVSTGGLENRRCRLPVREGLRVELQIWWDIVAVTAGKILDKEIEALLLHL